MKKRRPLLRNLCSLILLKDVKEEYGKNVWWNAIKSVTLISRNYLLKENVPALLISVYRVVGLGEIPTPNVPLDQCGGSGDSVLNNQTVLVSPGMELWLSREALFTRTSVSCVSVSTTTTRVTPPSVIAPPSHHPPQNKNRPGPL
uniref:Uncharacterized protein n=1 Tax=Cacopsylla melanoneura TaxID=428564 RepID=A0A8D8LGF8_9HEMI